MSGYQIGIIRYCDQPVHQSFVAVAVIAKSAGLHGKNVGDGIHLQYFIKCRSPIALIAQLRGLDFNLIAADYDGVFGTADLRQSLFRLFCRRDGLSACHPRCPPVQWRFLSSQSGSFRAQPLQSQEDQSSGRGFPVHPEHTASLHRPCLRRKSVLPHIPAHGQSPADSPAAPWSSCSSATGST